MLEKPKRAKQLNNQDRQLPATIQELINRYDLENKDIYKFLDYLVDNINGNKSEVIDNLESESKKDALSANQGRVLNEKIEGVVLFEDVNGDNGSEITLNDTIANYKEVKVEYVVGIGNYRINESKRTPITNGNCICLNYFSAHSETLQLFCTGRYIFSDTALTRVNLIRSRLDASPQIGWDGTTTSIYITKVIGYY